jgi:nucleotide-binding universal stress UspA family protein
MTIKPVVAGVDGSPESMQAVEWAAREARLHGAGLRIVSAAEMPPRMAMPPQATDIETVSAALRKNRDWALAGAAKAAGAMAPDVLIDTDPLDGSPALAVTDAGEGALMLVTGSTGSGAFSAMILGSVSRYAATHAKCPVVVVREETMAAHRQVIVGIRDPEDCAAALGFAFEEAALRHASLLAVHAWQSPRFSVPPVAYVPAAPVPPALVGDIIHEHVVHQMDQLLAAWRDKYPDVAASQDVVHGHPGRVLAGLSARADLVVLGRHHTHGETRPGTARVAHAVVSHAHGPVAIVPSA